MQWRDLIEAKLVRRYKRFLADVELADQRVITVHCPNTGAMTGCADPGSRVWLSTSSVKTRKYAHTWELVETLDGMACIHSAKANLVVRQAFEAGLIPGFERYPEIRSEVKYGENSRADLMLVGEHECAMVEVKSVTLCRAGGQGAFPDAVSARGTKHLQELARIRDECTRAVMMFCVFHEGVSSVCTAGDIDPRYREALIEAMASGVEVLAWQADISPQGVKLVRPLPFSVDCGI
jgi:sugar fermentation stimulation protein A